MPFPLGKVTFLGRAVSFFLLRVVQVDYFFADFPDPQGYPI